MFIWRLKKPLKSIFDIFPAMRFWNILLGLASFTTVERFDGVKVHFDDKGDKFMPAGDKNFRRNRNKKLSLFSKNFFSN